jgi:hypothetical protein
VIINNELVNKLIRLGESHATFSLQPRIYDIVDEHGRFLQAGERVPVLDAIRAVLLRASHLLPNLIHPHDLSGFSVSKDLWEALVISLERGEPEQKDMHDPEPIKIDAEIKQARAAHNVAAKVAEEREQDPRYSMDKFVKRMSTSPNQDLSKAILCQAGEGNAGWISSDGALSALPNEFPVTLAPTKHLEVLGYVREVDDAKGTASVEIQDYRDSYAKGMLAHHAQRVQLSFDIEAVERDDLLAIQYHQQAVWLRVSAVCATAQVHARHTRLALSRVLMDRAALDRWHAQARQTALPFD